MYDPYQEINICEHTVIKLCNVNLSDPEEATEEEVRSKTIQIMEKIIITNKLIAKMWNWSMKLWTTSMKYKEIFNVSKR